MTDLMNVVGSVQILPTTFDALDIRAFSQPSVLTMIILNQYEKYDLGITLSGTAEPLSQVEIAWTSKLPVLSRLMNPVYGASIIRLFIFLWIILTAILL